MTSIEAKRLAQRIARIEREQANQGKPQLAYSSIENGNLKSYEGNDLKMVVGLQDDGGQATTVFNGPTPPTPANYTVTVDHGSLTVHWDGEFENDVVAPSDWARWTAYAQEGGTVTPSRSTAIGGTDSASGGEVTAGVLKGQWTVTVLAWSQAGKPSAMGDPVTVDVPGYGEIVLEEIDAADTIIKNGSDILVSAQDTLGGKLDSAFGSIDSINDDMSDLGDAVAGAVASANGKNTVTYDERPPTTSDEGIAGDSWFVGQVGRPNDLVEATNIVANSSLETDAAGWSPYWWTGSGSRTQGAGAFGDWFYRLTATSAITGPKGRYHDVLTTVKSGQKWTLSIHVRPSRTMSLRPRGEFRGPSGVVGSAQHGNYFACPAGEWTRIHMTITAVGDATTIRHQTYLHDATLQAGDTLDLDAEMIALGQLAPYFDGDTEDGPTDNDPHYRYASTGTSEKYLPATEGLSSNWNVTEQYRFVNGAWENVELSHSVLSSLDLGKLVAGSAAIKEAVVQKLFAEVVVAKMVTASEFIGENAILTGAVTAPKIVASEELWAKIGEFVKIRAEQIEADAIDGMVITGPIIQSARDGQRWVGDTTGIRIFNADNEVRTQLSPDDSVFKGEVEADTLVVNGGSEMRSTENKLAQGAKLTLEAGVTDPTAPPTVQPYWDSLDFEISSPYTNVDGLVGLAYDGTHYWSAHKDDQGVRGQRARIYAVRIDPDTGVGEYVGGNLVAADAPWPSEVFGVTCVGSELFWLGRSLYDGVVWVTDLDGAFKRAFAYPDLNYTRTNPLGYKPGIGNDGTNVVIAHSSDAGVLIIRTYNKATGAQIGSTVSGQAADYKSDTSGVYVGTADDGAHRIYVRPSRVQHVSAYTTAGAIDASRRFDTPAPESTGVVYAGGKFHTLDPAGEIHEYADANTGDASSDWWATYRWSVDVDEDGSNDYVSRIGPVKRFTWPRRGKLKFLGAPLPVGAGYITPSIAKKTTTPTRTEFRTPPFSVYVGESVALLSVLPTDWLSGGSPGDANTFPEAESSVLTTASNTFRLQGDGSGHWGPLKMGRNGVMSGLIATGQVVITPDAANASKLATVTLPPGRFTSPPVVWVSIGTSAPHKAFVGCYQPTDTNTFDVYLNRDSTTTTGIQWYAMDGE